MKACFLAISFLIYYCALAMIVYYLDNKEKIYKSFKSGYDKCMRIFFICKESIYDQGRKAFEKYRETKNYIRNNLSTLDKGRILRWASINLCYLGVFIWGLWAFETKWIGWYNVHLNLYTNIPVDLANLLLIIYLVGIVVLIMTNAVYKRPFLWKERLYSVFFFAVLYFRYRVYDKVFDFTPLSFTDSCLTYVDIVFGTYVIYNFALLVIEYNRVRTIATSFAETDSFFYYDAPIKEEKDDDFNYHIPAKSIAQKLETLTRDHSWSIGIVGPWGSGKTSYIQSIINNLPKDKYLILQFNPRFASKPSNIQELALNLLEDAVEPYNGGIRKLMRRYIYALQLDDSSGWLHMFFAWIKSEYGVDSIKSELDEVLAKLPKQVLFIFDDFDRLTEEEIIEVLKLIDGNAKFRNIIYMAAYDRKQVGNLLKDASYIDKYFSIEIHVPMSQHVSRMNYIARGVTQILPPKMPGDKLSLSGEEVLQRHGNLFHKILATMRDAKHYLNMLKADVLTIYSQHIDAEDFLLLELLKYHDISLYETIYAVPDKYMDFGPNIRANKDHENLKQIDDELSKKIILILFPSNIATNNRPNKIRKRKLFFNYFIRPDEKTMHLELAELFEESISEKHIMSRIDNIVTDEKIRDEFLDLMDQYGHMYINDKASLERYIFIILYVNSCVGEQTNVPDTWNIFKDSFYSAINVQKKDIRVDNGYMGNFILEYYREKNIWTKGDISVLSRIVPDLYYESKNSEFVIKREAIEPLIRKSFEDYGEKYLNLHHAEDFEALMQIFYMCIEHIDKETTKIVLDASCCAKMREIIEKEPEAYINSFVRLGGESTSPDVNHIACEPFWSQIFGSSDALEEFMTRQDKDRYPRIVRMLNFWEIYKANNYKMIEFKNQGNVKEIIDNDLVEQKKQLDELRTLDGKIDNAVRMMNKGGRNLRLKEIVNRMGEIPLQVAYKEEVLYKAKNWMS